MTTATATGAEALNPDRVICSTITLRHLPLDQALDTIAGLGFTEIDLGALPGVCNHVPYELTADAVREVAEVVNRSGLTRPLGQRRRRRPEPAPRCGRGCRPTRARPATDRALPGRRQHRTGTAQRGAAARADRVPRRGSGPGRRPAEQHPAGCAAAGLELWVEAPHFFRLCYNLERADALTRLLNGDIGLICDVSHIVASGSTPRQFVDDFPDRIRHVHLRDAEAGYIHHSIGNGEVDFADAASALAEIGYTGKFSLELETRDIENDERPQAALKAGRYFSSLV